VLDDRELSAALKEIRHELAGATRGFAGKAILYRDTPGDVGTAIKTQGEGTRADLAGVVTAAGKRLGEALRSVEEFLKTRCPADAAKVESLRYRFYDIEHRLAFTLRPAACGLASLRLYVLITESACRIPWLEAAEQAILGGADGLQLREKNMEGGELLRRATQLVQLCRAHNVPCIVNDRPDVAALCAADGVHVGQGDLPAREVRKLLGPDRILGVSTHDVEQARRALLDGADYVGIGPVFRSPTKPRGFVAGLEVAREVALAVPQIPTVAIAGIDAGNVDEVLRTGVRAVAVTSAVLSADDVRGAAAKLKSKLGVLSDMATGGGQASGAGGDGAARSSGR
jgi:thiamine-phosphate pyrophosphorylase